MSKSPIETRLLDAIVRMRPEWAHLAIMHGPAEITIPPDDPDEDPDTGPRARVEAIGDEWRCAAVHRAQHTLRTCSLYRQVTALSYRADIVLGATGSPPIVIECDGHDFHDRTKQQAAYDRARDRELLGIGVVTLRFTGSEIHHSPERCAEDVWRVAHRIWVDEWQREMDVMERVAARCADHARRTVVGDVAIEEHW